MKKGMLESEGSNYVLGMRGRYQVLAEVLGDVAHGSLFAEHLLSRLLEVRTSFVIELLLRVSCSSLGLCIFQWFSIVLILIGRWSLLHPHHRGMITCSALATNSITDPTFSRHDRVLLSGLLNLWLLSDDIKHAIFQRFFVLTQSILFPSVVEYFGV